MFDWTCFFDTNRKKDAVTLSATFYNNNATFFSILVSMTWPAAAPSINRTVQVVLRCDFSSTSALTAVVHDPKSLEPSVVVVSLSLLLLASRRLLVAVAARIKSEG
jgi:hypothetical protein